MMASALGAGVAMYAFWQGFDARVLVIFVFFLALAEVFVQVRWRLNVVCPNCGFDPVLYLRDTDKAAEKVKIHLTRRKEDPISLFRRPLNIPSISQEKAQKLAAAVASQNTGKFPAASESKGTVISKQV